MMFERFTDRARRVVVDAQEEARLLRHPRIGTEHLLLGLLRQEGGTGAAALAHLEIDLSTTRDDVVDALGEGPPAPLGRRDAQALAAIGIDLDEVRARADDAFGAGSLDRSIKERRRRAGRCDPWIFGHLPFSPRAKRALEISLREAVELRHGSIGTEHILLGLVQAGGVATDLLATRGASPLDVRRAVIDEIRRRDDASGRSA